MSWDSPQNTSQHHQRHPATGTASVPCTPSQASSPSPAFHGNTAHPWMSPPSLQIPGTRKYLGYFGIVLELLELALVALDEVLEHGVVVVHGVLALGQLQAPLQLLHVQQDVLQGHCERKQERSTHSLSDSRQEEPGVPGNAAPGGCRRLLHLLLPSPRSAARCRTGPRAGTSPSPRWRCSAAASASGPSTSFPGAGESRSRGVGSWKQAPSTGTHRCCPRVFSMLEAPMESPSSHSPSGHHNP